MKYLVPFVVLLALSNSILAQSFYQREGSDILHLWGEFDVDIFKNEDFSEWYNKSLPNYLPDLSEFQEKQLLNTCTVDIYIGTWCGDSQNWVPKFIELWTSIGLSEEQLHIIALKGGREYYKQGPNGEEIGKNIHRVPTFIFHQEELEIGRIVERPVHSLERDLAQIDRGVPTSPRYRAVTVLNDFFQKNDTFDFSNDHEEINKSIYREVTGAGELNTYGYVLKAADRIDEALFVFRLNTLLFEYAPNCFDSLGELYMEKGEYALAKECFERVISLNPSDERAFVQIESIETLMKK